MNETLRALIEIRIREQISDFKIVSGAADIKSITSAPMPTTPGCFVFRDHNSVSDNNLINIVSQQRTEYIGLLVVTRDVRDARGGVNSDENERLCDLIQVQLLGHEPSTDYAPMEYAGGTLVLMRDGFHFWREIYRSWRLIRSI